MTVSNVAQKQATTSTKKQPKRDYVYAVGRQKETVARVRLYAHVKDNQKYEESEVKKEQILVNGMPVEHYFVGPIAKKAYMQPFELTGTFSKYAITIKVAGGGNNGQLDASVKGIARVLAKIDPIKFRAIMKTNGLLTRDARVRERRKVGTGGKARRQKSSPKR